MPPWSPILGHLAVAKRVVSALPSDAHGYYLADQVRRMYPDLGPDYYLDLYPFAPSMLVVKSPEILRQVTQENPLPKHPGMTTFLKPLTDGLDLVTMEGQTWKSWRSVFNPGFSASHLMTLVPSIVDSTWTFCAILGDHSTKGDVIKLKDLTDNLTMEVIGKIVLDTNLDCQLKRNPIVSSLLTQIRWLSFGHEPSLWTRYHPLRPLVHWYHSRITDNYMSLVVDKHWKRHRQDDDGHRKSIIDLALTTYEKQEAAKAKRDAAIESKMDPIFKKVCVSQAKLFLFSGHDTTSSSICYVLYLLSRYSSTLETLKVELSDIFASPIPSPSVDSIPAQISGDPHILNKLPYLNAIIRESLRLFPVVSSTRTGAPGLPLPRNSAGQIFPTKDFLVWVNPHAIHHDPRYWKDPDAFIPERWLDDPDRNDVRGQKVKEAYRPFEQGARNCIGQELAMLEMKIAVVMVIFAGLGIKDVYAERDRMEDEARARSWLGKKGKKRDVLGERAYQVQLSQPEGDLPCRIERVKTGKE